MDIIRVGRVSSIDYEKGLVSVYYEDKGASVSSSMPVLSNGEYKMHGIGEMVVTAHLSNGTAHGIVLGTIFNDAQLPEYSGQGTYYKKLCDNCYIKGASGNIVFNINSGSVSISQILGLMQRVAELEERVSALGG